MEIWKDIAGYEGLYQVSNFGRVKSFKRYPEGRIMNPSPDARGYLRVALLRDGKNNRVYIHQLVAEAFLSNPESKPEVGNLEWATVAENLYRACALRFRDERSPLAKLTDEQVLYVRENPDNLTGRQLAKMFGCCPQTISDVQRGKKYKNADGKIRGKIDIRLPDELREQIRREYVFGSSEFGLCALAKKYGLAHATISRIVNEV